MSAFLDDMMDESPQDAQRFQQVCDAFTAAWKAGVRVAMEPFLAPVSASQQPALFRELLSVEVTCRRACGEFPTAADYTDKYPQYAELILHLLSGTNLPPTSYAVQPHELTPTSARPISFDSLGPNQLPDVPGYELRQCLGMGGMGVVYQAMHKATRREVAVKMLPPAQSADDVSTKLFLREATTLSQLNHKRIVKFLEVGITSGQLYLVMEYVNTVDFDQFLTQRSEPRLVRLVCGLICQVLEGLDYAHHLGFVHRDVKPGNVLVTREEAKYRTKLADFGLAKSFENAGFSSLTSMGECRGTVPFMSPEQLNDPRSVGPATDIFSTAATLYFYLTRHCPYDLASANNAVMAVLQGQVIPVERWRPDLPASLAAVIHRGLAKRPEDRFTSAQAMRRELIGFAKGPAT